jgi:hypothetical protein
VKFNFGDVLIHKAQVVIGVLFLLCSVPILLLIFIVMFPLAILCEAVREELRWHALGICTCWRFAWRCSWLLRGLLSLLWGHGEST